MTLVLAPKLKQPERPILFVLAPAADLADARPEDDLTRLRLRVRIWETRRTWAARALIAIGVPVAYLLIMLAAGTPAPLPAVRVVVGLWLAGLAAGIVCAEAVWRNRRRLEQLTDGRDSASRL